MDVVLIHRPRGLCPPEMMKGQIELVKKLFEKTEELVPGGKIIAAYHARCQGLTVCIWEVPSTDNLVPVFEQMSNLGLDTEIIPADKVEVAIAKWEKAMAEMAQK